MMLPGGGGCFVLFREKKVVLKYTPTCKIPLLTCSLSSIFFFSKRNYICSIVGKGKVDDEEIAVWFSAGTSVNFVLNNNLTVLTRRVKYSPINKFVWNFASRGLTSVGQDEVVILLEAGEEEALPPRDIFIIIQSIYEQVFRMSILLFIHN